MIEKINTRLDLAITNLNKDNFEILFPLILDDLEYLLYDLKKDRKKLSPTEDFEYGTTITKKTTQYLAKLAKIYFKTLHNIDINIINKEDYNLSIAGGAYDSKNDNIYYSDFGVIISKQSELSFLHTCLHEGRHKIQHKYYETDELLSIPPYMLRLLKESLLEGHLKENNREFYMENYNSLFTENDAEIFAKQEINNLINNLSHLYNKLYKKSPRETHELSIKIKRINDLINEILTQETFNINNDIISKIYAGDIINCDYKVSNKNVDRLIAMDKFIKSNPELQNQYPILRLLFNENVPKSYEEIIFDKEILKENKSVLEQQKIDNLYDEIITLDPILTLTQKIEQGDIESVKEYLTLHPTLINEYPDEIQKLYEKYGNFKENITSLQEIKK